MKPLRIAHNLRDAALLASIRNALAARGGESRLFEVGVDAASQVARDPPDALLLRVAGPAVLERGLIERLARGDKTPPVPVVVLSPRPEDEGALAVFDVVPEPVEEEAPRVMERLVDDLLVAARRAQVLRSSVPATPAVPAIPAIHGGRAVLAASEFQRLADIVTRQTGLLLENGKVQGIAEAVHRRVRALAYARVGLYLAHLAQSAHPGGELERLLPALVVGETSFFRTPAHFAALREVVIPDLLRRRSLAAEPIRVWSAGCASGEEAYSLAITFREAAADLSPSDVRILATEIDPTALARARAGSYRPKDVRKVPPDLLDRYFVRMGERYDVSPAIRDMVEFAVLDLHSGWRTTPHRVPRSADVILCENVMIYFRKDLIPPLLERLGDVLAPGGYLFLGYSESLYKVSHPFEDHTYGDTFFYRKPRGDTRIPGLEPERRRPRNPTRILVVPHRTASPPSPSGVEGPRPEPVEGAPALQPQAAPAAADPRPLGARKDEARERLLAGDFPAARALFEGILREDPASSGARIGLAFLRLKKGDAEGAEVALDEVLRDNPLAAEVHYFRGLVAQGRGDAARARQHHERALFLNADFVPAHVQLGELASAAGLVAEALRHFRNAAGALRRAPGTAVISLEGAYREEDLAAILDRDIAALEASLPPGAPVPESGVYEALPSAPPERPEAEGAAR